MQFGATLQRILQRLVYCNKDHGPPLLAKLDLADGYYRVPLAPQAALHLAVVIPSDEGSDPLIAIPLSLPMGWAQSPPYFCAYTETIVDLCNNPANCYPSQDHPCLQPQKFLQPTESCYDCNAITITNPAMDQLQYTDVYIDDFIALVQSPHSKAWLNRLLHALDTVFMDPPNSPRRQIVSASKIAKGDACLSTCKRILGWEVDTAKMHLLLPQHRLEALQCLLKNTMVCKRVSRKNWHKLLGILRSTTPALYGAHHLFSMLQHALGHRPGRIRLTTLLRATLQEWLSLANTAHLHPMPIVAVVPRCPTTLAATDASKQGMGGFVITPQHNGERRYDIWRAPFDTFIQKQLVSTDNPAGTVTNSDLELTSLLVGAYIAAHAASQPHPHIAIATDNTSAQSWLRSGSTTTINAPAYLLHTFTRLRRKLPFTVSPVYTPGLTNQLADCCSRLFHMDDDTFLEHMNNAFPVQPSWTLVTPPKEVLLQMNSALLRKLPPKEWRENSNELPTLPGICGPSSVKNCGVTLTLPTYKTQSH
jgi:hypothetical protein